MRIKTLAFLAVILTVVFFIPASSFAQIQPSDWPIGYVGDNSNATGSQTSLPLNLVLKNDPLISGTEPLASSGEIIYADESKGSSTLVAVNPATNTVKWRYTPENDQTSINWVMARDGIAYFTTASGLYAVQDTGAAPKLLWSHKPGGNRITYDDSAIYYMGSDQSSSTAPNQLIALDMKTGTERWNINVGNVLGRIEGPLATGGGYLYFGLNDANGGYSYTLCAVNTATGKVVWKTRLGYAYTQASEFPLYSNGKVYLDLDLSPTGKELHQVEAFNALTGASMWSYDLKEPFGITDPHRRRLCANQESIFFINQDGYLVAINKDTGAERWKTLYADIVNQLGTKTVIPSANAALATPDKVFLSDNGRIKIYDASNGLLLRDFTPGSGGYSPAAIANGMLVVTKGAGLSTLAPAATGSDTTKPTAVFDSVSPLRFSPYERARPDTQAYFCMSEDSLAKMEVLNQNEEVVRQINFGFEKGTWNYLKWDGKDDKGKMALYGKYHFRLTLTDMSGNVGTYEYKDKIVTITDIYGTVAQTANLRSGPGTNYSILATIRAGTGILIADESGNWYKTADSVTGQTGYISKNLVAARTNPNSLVPANPSTKYQCTMQKGVTLDQIAANYGVTVNDIMTENHLTSANSFTVGQVLNITVYYYYSLPVYYVVQSGDTLWSIAQKNHVTMDTIIKNNNLTNPNNLYIGQRLLISQ